MKWSMKPTFKIVLFARKTIDGKQPVNLRVTYARKSRYFTLNRYCLPEQFDKKRGRFRSGFRDWQAENDVLLAIEKRAADYIRHCERERLPFDFGDFEKAVFAMPGKTSGPVAWKWCEDVSEELYRQGRAGNAVAKIVQSCTIVARKMQTPCAGGAQGVDFVGVVRSRPLSGVLSKRFSWFIFLISFGAVCGVTASAGRLLWRSQNPAENPGYPRLQMALFVHFSVTPCHRRPLRAMQR